MADDDDSAHSQPSDEIRTLGAKHEQKHLQPAAALPGAAASPAAKQAHVIHVNSAPGNATRMQTRR